MPTSPSAARVAPHLTPSRRGRPADDPIFALNAEAERAAGEGRVHRERHAREPAERRRHARDPARRRPAPCARSPPVDWAAYAPIAGNAPFLKAVVEDVFRAAASSRRRPSRSRRPGGTGALRHAIATFLEPGQALLTTSYYWGPYATIADEQERRVETFPMFSASGALDVAALDAALAAQVARQGRALLFLNDPCHNPTGYSMSAADWRGHRRRARAARGEGARRRAARRGLRAYGPGRGLDVPLAALAPLVGPRARAGRVDRDQDLHALRPARRRPGGPRPGRDGAGRRARRAHLRVPRHLVELQPRRHGRRDAPADRRADCAPRSTRSARARPPAHRARRRLQRRGEARRASSTRATTAASSRRSSRPTPTRRPSPCAASACTSCRSRARCASACARCRRPTWDASSSAIAAVVR